MKISRFSSILTLGVAILVVSACNQNSGGPAPTTAGGASSSSSSAIPGDNPANPAISAEVVDSSSACAKVHDPVDVKVPANGNKQQWSAPAQVIDNSHQYCAVLTTEHGKIVFELYPQYAPKNVNNFVFLATNGFYDGVPFHRVIPGFMAQTGDPTGTGTGGPGYSNIPLEAVNEPILYDRPGVVGVARTSVPDSAGSQFFITFGPSPNLNHGYTIIGRVVVGMSIVNAIKIRNLDSDPNAQSIVPEQLLSVRIIDLGAK